MIRAILCWGEIRNKKWEYNWTLVVALIEEKVVAAKCGIPTKHDLLSLSRIDWILLFSGMA